MIKINYPSNSAERTKLEDEYWELFNEQQSEFDSKIKASPTFVAFFSGVSYRQIVLGDIKYLVDLFYKFDALSPLDKGNINKEFKCVFSYDQPKISRFFEEHNSIFNLRACHYCNLDYVSVFHTLDGYSDELDFMRRTTKSELMDIKKIGVKKAKTIMKLPDRKNYICTFNHPKPVKKLLNVLETTEGKSRNHFTLDHFIPQSRCCLFARSLYNFVPSCYVCNSKLKHTRLLSDNIDELHKYSPTYEYYEETGEIEFSLRQSKSINIFDCDKPDRDMFLDNFNIDVEAVDSNNNIVSVLHLRQRYHIHKEAAVRLAYLREKYSDATVAEIERILTASGCKTTSNMIKNDIFHNPTHNNESLSKLRKDVMKQLGI